MNKLGNVFSAIGILILLAAALLTVHNIRDDNRAKATSEMVVAVLEDENVTAPTVPQNAPDETVHQEQTQSVSADTTEETIPDYALDPNREMPVKKIDGKDYIGILEIPEISITLPVMGEWDYPKLKDAPCRYSGSPYQDNLVIMAHNFQSHFGKIGKLSVGSRVTFTDLDDNVFTYQVAYTEVLEPTEVEDVTSGVWPLTLFTCTTGGQYRSVVRCELV